METNASAFGRARRVLIVDDEVTIRVALRRFFTRLGWAVEEASNGASALELLNLDARQSVNDRFDVVVSDLRMPGLDGIELYEQLKELHPELVRRLIVSTGDLVSEDTAMFVRTTECVVLQKPFELNALRALVDQVVADEVTG